MNEGINQLNKLKNVLALLQNDTITPAKLKEFLTLLIGIVKETREQLAEDNKEDVQTIKDYVAFIEEKHQEMLDSVEEKNETASTDFNTQITEVKALIKKLKTLKDGKDGRDGKDGVSIKGKDGKDGKDGSPDTGEDIVAKINSLPTDKDVYKISAEHINGLKDFVGKTTVQVSRTLEGMQDINIENLTKDTFGRYILGSGGSGGTWGSITGTLSDQTDLQAALDAKQATLVSGTNIKTVNGSSILGSGDLNITGAISDGDYGDITVSGGSTVWTIDNLAVTDAKINSVAWSKITSTPTTLSGYGITDAQAALNGTGFVKISGTTISYDNSTYLTTASAASTYQPLDSDLTTIAGLAATTDNFIVSVASAWASRTPSQVRTTLGLVIGTNVQAWDADLDTWATKTAPSGVVIGTTDAQALTNKSVNGVTLVSGGTATKYLSEDGTYTTPAGGASGITIGTTTITSGTTTRVLYNNAGVVGEYVVSGSGNVAMTTSPVFTTPNIGSATGSISGNAGTATALQNARTIGGVSFDGTGNIVPQTIQSVNEATDTTCFPLFISASGSQSLQPLNNVGFTYNSNTNALTATTFIGALTGNASTATNVAVGGITGLGTGVATALAINVGSAGAFVTFNGALGTPSSGTVTNLTGTASININGTVGATTPAAGTFTAATANSFVPNSSTIPTNGMYLPAANTLGWAINSAIEVQLTGTALSPGADGGSSLGTTALGWQNLFANTGFVLNIENSNWVATHTAGILTVGTGDLRVTNAGANTASVVTVGGSQTLTSKTLTTPVINGTITGTGQATAATASTIAMRDASGNSTFTNVLEGYTTTATAAGTTTLVVGSNNMQYFTGSTTQTVVMPVTSTLVLGQSWWIVNLSTGAVTINSSGGNAIVILAAGTSAELTCILTTGTTAASWNAMYVATINASGKKATINNTLTLAGTDATTMTFPTTSATIARTDAGQTFTGVNTFTAPVMVTSINTSSTSFTAFAGATTLLTIGGTGASASMFAPSTLDASSSTTGAIRTSGGLSAAKSANIGTTLTVGTGYQIGGAATSGKMLKGNGTNFVASTETYAAPGTSGNVMTSDGTNWTSAAPAAPAVTKIVVSTVFETSARFKVVDSNGSQSRSFGEWGLSVGTGATSNSYLEIGLSFGPQGTTNNINPMSGSPTFSANFSVVAFAGTSDFYVGMGAAGGGTAYNGANHVGFKVLVSAGVATLYGTNANGTESVTSALTTLAVNDNVDVICVMTSNTNVAYYWRLNGGSLSSATNITTNIPTTGSGGKPYPIYVAIKNSSANANDFSVHSASYTR